MSLRGWLALVLLAALCTLAVAQDTPGSAAGDPIVRAMKTELARSMDQLRLDHAQPPYYVEYSVIDVDQFTASASFGALRNRLRAHARVVRAVVRVGDYKQDSYEGAGRGTSISCPWTTTCWPCGANSGLPPISPTSKPSKLSPPNRPS